MHFQCYVIDKILHYPQMSLDGRISASTVLKDTLVLGTLLSNQNIIGKSCKGSEVSGEASYYTKPHLFNPDLK
ncbi:hypothetical protein [Roseivirga spongicola]|uniref:hypothetical protein n=1 Tax=Roseivirga spongicola TaxID=333140 RepID=UPI002AC8EFFF|nr:hypothetical protein [Roseivirga spongicola]WPZ11652.1 hypothetical protein T7867_05980 [Roseivirga spongicola]